MEDKKEFHTLASMKEEKEKMVTYSFKIPESLMSAVRKKIDVENSRAKDLKSRTNLSRKMQELLYDYASR